MNDDLISREATLKPYKDLNEEDTISVWLIRKNIEQQPSINIQEPKFIAKADGTIEQIKNYDGCSKEQIDEMIKEIANLSIVSNYGESITREMAELYSFKHKVISIIVKHA